MESAMFLCPGTWRPLLPPGIRLPEGPGQLGERTWEILALTPEGLSRMGPVRCRILLAPGDCGTLKGLEAERVVTYGLSHRDSLTLSSLAEPVLCVQRTLPRPDGAVVEPQEFPLPPLPFPAAELLPLLGLRLLQMPLTGNPFSW